MQRIDERHFIAAPYAGLHRARFEKPRRRVFAAEKGTSSISQNRHCLLYGIRSDVRVYLRNVGRITVQELRNASHSSMAKCQYSPSDLVSLLPRIRTMSPGGRRSHSCETEHSGVTRALLCNPRHYRIEDALNDLVEDLWAVSRETCTLATGSPSGKRRVRNQCDGSPGTVLTDPADIAEPECLQRNIGGRGNEKRTRPAACGSDTSVPIHRHCGCTKIALDCSPTCPFPVLLVGQFSRFRTISGRDSSSLLGDGLALLTNPWIWMRVPRARFSFACTRSAKEIPGCVKTKEILFFVRKGI